MILDTNILIAYINGEDEIIEFISSARGRGAVFFISSISVAEVLAYPPITPREILYVRSFLHDLVSVPFDNEVAEKAALFKRTYNLTIPDAAIAATAYARLLPLVTRDKDFQNIKEITLIQV